MSAINLTRAQMATLATLQVHMPEGGDMWLHSELESIYVDFMDAKSKTTEAFRLYENGQADAIQFPADEEDDDE